jgi:phage terminase small subunit
VGLRGIQRQPDSVRSLRDGAVTYDAPETVKAPAWLPAEAVKQFDILAQDLVSANVPVKQADSNAIACTAQCITDLAYWSKKKKGMKTVKDLLNCSKLIARYQSDLQKWLNAICATPKARASMGLKATPKKKGTFATLIDLKKGNDTN